MSKPSEQGKLEYWATRCEEVERQLAQARGLFGNANGMQLYIDVMRERDEAQTKLAAVRRWSEEAIGSATDWDNLLAILSRDEPAPATTGDIEATKGFPPPGPAPDEPPGYADLRADGGLPEAQEAARIRRPRLFVGFHRDGTVETCSEQPIQPSDVCYDPMEPAPARSDTERLDRMDAMMRAGKAPQENGDWGFRVRLRNGFSTHDTLREAIDAAIDTEEGQG